MIFLYWLPTTVVPALCMLPVISMTGMFSASSTSAPAGSLQGDLE